MQMQILNMQLLSKSRNAIFYYAIKTQQYSVVFTICSFVECEVEIINVNFALAL